MHDATLIKNIKNKIMSDVVRLDFNRRATNAKKNLAVGNFDFWQTIHRPRSAQLEATSVCQCHLAPA